MSSVRPAFLISLPRSGSTLLQRLLGAHSQVTTIAEPWLLLPPLYALRDRGVYSEYGHRFAAHAIADMCAQLPGGSRDYLRAVAGMAEHIYTALSPPGTRVFLDKTPRYGLVIDQIVDTFPDSTFIVIHRNPLSVIASLTSTFARGRWKPHRYKQDLYLLAERLLSAQGRSPNVFTPVRYEDLLSEPESTLRRVVEALELDWEPTVLDSLSERPLVGRFGDPTGTRVYDHISKEPLYKWPQELGSPLRKRWVRRYLKWLGAERIDLMGYDLKRLLDDLEQVPSDYGQVPLDIFDGLGGVVWSVSEVEIARDKLKSLPRWRDIFSHR